MLTKEEYKRIAIRMFDSIREDSHYLGECRCVGTTGCSQCPLGKVENCNCDCFEFTDGLDKLFESFKTLEGLEKWAKENPLPTYEDKYVETFGVRPVNEDGEYVCPSIAGFGKITEKLCSSVICDECCKTFWKSEYIPPKHN